MGELEQEFAYTSYRDSCKAGVLLGSDGELPEKRECRRANGHEGDHASGFGEHLYQW